jgi:RNA recognition motif-containing protein
MKILKEKPTKISEKSEIKYVEEKPKVSIIKKIPIEDKENYKIVYDKKYTGIKKRNTPVDEIQNYIINIQNIINEKDSRTTLMIKNIPSYITQTELLDKIDINHINAYNFFYLPIDFNKKSNAGYAFINFKSAKMIINFVLEFNNKPWGFKDSNKIAYVSYARIQGFRAISSHFKKSNIMKQVDDKVKPIIINT